MKQKASIWGRANAVLSYEWIPLNSERNISICNFNTIATSKIGGKDKSAHTTNANE